MPDAVPEGEAVDTSDLPVTFRRNQVADFIDQLGLLNDNPFADLTPDERKAWEHVRATATRLADEMED